MDMIYQDMMVICQSLNNFKENLWKIKKCKHL